VHCSSGYISCGATSSRHSLHDDGMDLRGTAGVVFNVPTSIVAVCCCSSNDDNNTPILSFNKVLSFTLVIESVLRLDSKGVNSNTVDMTGLPNGCDSIPKYMV